MSGQHRQHGLAHQTHSAPHYCQYMTTARRGPPGLRHAPEGTRSRESTRPTRSLCQEFWTPVPIPHALALELSTAVEQWPGKTVISDVLGRPCSPWELQRAVRTARDTVEGLPEGFRYHDLRHYFASLLIFRRRRQGRPEAPSPRQRDDHTQHLRPHVARRRRVHTRRSSGRPGCSCGLWCPDGLRTN